VVRSLNNAEMEDGVPDDRVADLERRVRDLEDRLHTLALSVAYSDDEPYFAEVSRAMLGGDERVVLGLVLSGILSRASGREMVGPPDRGRLNHPALDAAFRPGPITYDEAVQIVAMVVGDEDSARRLIEAHQRQGLGEEGHRHLGAAGPRRESEP
jgi:hypothetical protein